MTQKGLNPFFKILGNSRGQGLVVLAMTAVAVLVFSGTSVEVARAYGVRQFLRKIADATAVAAVVQTPTHDEAVQIVHDVAELNQAGGSSFIDSSEIEVGTWDFQSRTFTASDPGTEDNTAVRVTVRRSESNGSPLRLIFGPIVGIATMDVLGKATAAVDYPLCGIIGINQIDVTGDTLVDSYHSGDGSYSTGSASEHGTLCSNGNIALKGNAEVHGDAIPGEDEEVTLTGGASITGSTTPRTSPLVVASVALGDAATVNDNDQIPLTSSGKNPINAQGELAISGQDELVLPAGTYYFTGLRVAGQAVIRVTGPVVIFVDGDIDIGGGGIINESQIPSDLQIFGTGNSAAYRGTSDFYGLLYASEASIAITGTAAFFGAIVGLEVKIDGTPGIHYDEDLEPFIGALRGVPILVE